MNNKVIYIILFISILAFLSTTFYFYHNNNDYYFARIAPGLEASEAVCDVRVALFLHIVRMRDDGVGEYEVFPIMKEAWKQISEKDRSASAINFPMLNIEDATKAIYGPLATTSLPRIRQESLEACISSLNKE